MHNALIELAFLAFAQESPAPEASPLASAVMPLLLMAVVFYFLMIRPQQKQQKAHQDFILKLKLGDEIVTESGLIGKIVQLTDRVAVLDFGNKNSARVLKSKIIGHYVEGAEPSTAKDEAGAKDKDKA